MQKITPFLWFMNDAAEEAANFYVSLVRDSKVTGKMVDPGTGKVLTVSFELAGQQFVALNGNPEFQFNHSFSLVINCQNQEEVDLYWNKFSEGGQPVMCGWIKDKYGFSWQITPTVLIELISDKDRMKAKRVFEAMSKMVKIDIAALQKAYEG
jgi:predicted 3-demethylubiquinone-9 3-methyltransferase (glyoxalase superfamily)